MPVPERTIARPVSASEFEASLLRYINEVLPRLDRQRRSWTLVAANTPLFATGLLDSLSILHLIRAVEDLTGRTVSDELVVMKHFQTVETMGAAFWPATPEDNL